MLSRLLPPRRDLYLISKIALSGAALSILLQDNFYELTPVAGSSMSPTISPLYHTTGQQDHLLWSKSRPTKNLQRGDIVLYHTPHNPERSGVKRIVALGGDTVILDRRRRPGYDAYGDVNSLETTAAKNWDRMAGVSGRVQVPFGHVWLEGDNWRKSMDSNHFGPVSKSLIVGKAKSVVWPLEKFGSKPWEEFLSSETKVVKGRDEVPEVYKDLYE